MAKGTGRTFAIIVVVLLLIGLIGSAAYLQSKKSQSSTSATTATPTSPPAAVAGTPSPTPVVAAAAAGPAAAPGATPAPIPAATPAPTPGATPGATPGPVFTGAGLNWVSTGTQNGVPRYLDCANGGCSPNDKLEIWQGTGAPGQKWTLNGSLSSGGYCVDASANPPAPMACNSSAAQTWTWVPDAATGAYQLQNSGTGTCLDVARGADANGTAMQMYPCSSSWTRWRLGSPLFLLTNPGTVLSIAVSPLDGLMYGVGSRDHYVYSRARNSSSWTVITNPCCVTAIDFCAGNQLNGVALGGNVNGVSTAQQVYYKTSSDVSSAWALSANSGSVIDIAWNALTNTLWGVGTDNRLYYRAGATWVLKGAGVTGLVSISIANDGRQWVTATDGFLYRQTTAGGALNTSADFTMVPGTSGVLSVACDRFSSVIYVVTRANIVTTASIRQDLTAF